MRTPLFAALLLLPAVAPSAAPKPSAGTLEAEVDARDVDAIKKRGPGVMPALAKLYEAGDTARKIAVAGAFYQLGWKSPEAKRALMKDVRTADPTLRISVQYALGRVSCDEDVVDTLLENMQDDANPLFRDKAACALAYDQIHLTPVQKFRLYEGLVRALEDPKPDVRRIALLALSIQTGQTKKIEEWKRWIAEYRSNLSPSR